jgi:pyruvate dehydrogenase E1 component beta subunit
MPELTMVEAIRQALAYEMENDPQVLVLGQDIGTNGGVFRATEGLQEKFGKDRAIDTPLAEVLIGGMSLGLASQRLKPVAEIQFSGFMYSNIDNLLNHAGRLRHRSRGRLGCPMVLRSPSFGGIHAPEHHSESPEAMFAHIPGIRVVCPSSPSRAYGLLLAAIRDPDPVVFLEPSRLYRFNRQSVPNDGEALPPDVCFSNQAGTDVTLVSWGAMMIETMQAAEELKQQGVSAEVIDVATLKTLDMQTILNSVAKTGRCVIIHEAPISSWFGAGIAAQLANDGLLSLMAPVKRVAGFDTPMPLARMERAYIPSVKRILDTVHEVMNFE